MKKIFNGLFYFLKFLLYLAAFGLTVFILVRMNIRLEKNFTTLIPQLLPFGLLLILLIINLFLRQKSVNNNIFYNITSCLVFATIIFVSYRAMFDTNMVLNEKYGYEVEFNYFDNFIPYIKIMLYGLIISDIFFMFRLKDNDERNSKKTKKA